MLLTRILFASLAFSSSTSMATTPGPDGYTFSVQAIIGSETRSFDTIKLTQPPYPVDRSVGLQAGQISYAAVSLPTGRIRATVTGYAPNISSYAAFQETLTLSNLPPGANNYVDITVNVPGSVEALDGIPSCGIDLYAFEATNFARLHADFTSSAVQVATLVGSWQALGAGPSRTFTTRMTLGAATSTQIVLSFAVSGDSPAAGHSFSLTPETLLSLPTGATMTSASGVFLAAAASKISYH